VQQQDLESCTNLNPAQRSIMPPPSFEPCHLGLYHAMCQSCLDPTVDSFSSGFCNAKCPPGFVSTGYGIPMGTRAMPRLSPCTRCITLHSPLQPN